MSTTRNLLSILALVFVVACAPAPQEPVEAPDTREADEAAIRAAVRDWTAAAEAKDADRFASFYMDDGVLMLEGMPDIHGQSDLREGMTGMMQDPNFSLSFDTDDVEVARSGDMAYETGTYTMTVTDPSTSAPVTERGSYVVVWRKQDDGSWKVAVDAPLSDPSEPTEPAPDEPAG
jgi:uncharacterized protein (TIGR02246 family)